MGDRELVIAGIRPEHFEDASVLDSRRQEGGVVVDVNVDVTEWLGNELYAYVPYEPDAAVRAKLEELDRDLDGEGIRTQLVVALDAQSRVRDGDRARLWFDPARVHLFDPESGETLARDEAEAARIDKENEELRRQSLERAQKAAAGRSGDGADAGGGMRVRLTGVPGRRGPGGVRRPARRGWADWRRPGSR